MKKSYIHNEIKTYCQYFDFSNDELNGILYKTNGFISGSFALSVYLNLDIYPDADLDIFVILPFKHDEKYQYFHSIYLQLIIEKYHKFLTEKGYKLKDLCGKKNYDLESMKKPTNDIPYFTSALSIFIKNITNYISPNNKKVQIIMLYNWSIEELLDTFDLNINRLAIHSVGNQLQFYHYTNKYITDNELVDILHKRMYIYNPLYPANLEKRVTKYISRGFQLVNPQSKQLLFDHIPTFLDVSDYLLTFSNNVITVDEYLTNKNKRTSHIIEKEIVKVVDIVDDIVDDGVETIYDSDEDEVKLKSTLLPTLIKPIKSSKPELSFGENYVYPVNYCDNQKEFIVKTVKQYLTNIDNCPTKLLKIIETIQLLDFLISNYSFIDSNNFSENKKFVVTVYKKFIEFKTIKFEPSNESEKIIFRRFQTVIQNAIDLYDNVKITIKEAISL